MGRNVVAHLVDLFKYSYMVEFMQKIIKTKQNTEAIAFNLTYHRVFD